MSPFLLRAPALWFVMAWLIAGCSGNEEPGAFCPTAGDRGPALAGGVHLVAVHSLGETWSAAPLPGTGFLATDGLVGQTPNDVDVVGRRIYVVNSGDNTVSILDAATGETVGCIDLGRGANPWAFAVDPADSSRAWVTTFVGGELVELDLAAERVLRRAPVGPALEGVWVGEDTVAVTLTGFAGTEGNFGPGSVVFLRKDTLAETARLAVPPNAQSLFRGADGNLHVVCTGNFGDAGGSVVRVTPDGASVLDTLALGGSPSRAVLAPDGTAFVSAFFGGVMAYDTVSFNALFDAQNPLTPETGYAGLTLWGPHVYVANFDLDAVAVIDWNTRTVVDGWPAGDGPIAVTVVPDPS